MNKSTNESAPTVEPENEWEHHAKKLTHWLYCMSYNDSYFGEPAGLVKQVTAQLQRLIGKQAKLAPVECEPVGYMLTELSGQPREDDGELYVYSHPFVCNEKTDCRPVYFHPHQGIDEETLRGVIEFVRWIASLKTGGLIQARANDLLNMLEKGIGKEMFGDE